MTALHWKIALYGGAAIAAWWLTSRRPPPTGSVELGVPTLNGIYGADTYYSDHYVAGGAGAPQPAIPPVNPAVNKEMRDLIDRSNAAIAAEDQ
jgi:hypothetical protein